MVAISNADNALVFFVLGLGRASDSFGVLLRGHRRPRRGLVVEKRRLWTSEGAAAELQ